MRASHFPAIMGAGASSSAAPLLLEIRQMGECAAPRRVTRPAFGSCTAITSTAIRGANNDTPMTENEAQVRSWQSCVIDDIIQQTPSIKSFFLRLSKPFAHTAGQHVDIRLTAPDGYSAMRSYSIASSAVSTPIVEIAIERMPDAEVSPFFHDIAAIGDEIEVRGPLGGHFLWPEPAIDPVLLIGRLRPRAVDGNDPAAPRIGLPFRQRCSCPHEPPRTFSSQKNFIASKSAIRRSSWRSRLRARNRFAHRTLRDGSTA